MEKRRQQPRIKGEIKVPTGSSMPPKLRAKIESDARRFRCSKSWVMVTALGAFYSVDVVPMYAD